MTKNQKIVGVTAAIVLALVILFPPHEKEHFSQSIFTEGEFKDDVVEDTFNTEWEIRFIGAKSSIYEFEDFRDQGNMITHNRTSFKIMITEWLALIGFVILTTIGIMILFKPNDTNN